jgi:hypothetical protein
LLFPNIFKFFSGLRIKKNMDEGNPLILKEEVPEVQEEESGFSGIFVSCSEGVEGNLSR